MSPTPFQALAQVPNACQALPHVVTGGQPTEAQLEAFRAAGGEVVLDLRDPSEPRPLDEPATARRLGLEYVVVPVTAGTLNDETLDRVRAALRGARGRRLFFHCRSGARVGAGLIPYLILDEEMEEGDAIETARRVGLNSPELLSWAVEYARRKRSRP